MSGGTISGNTALYGTYSSGGGVSVSNSTFMMSGGTISGNTALYGGGGVYVFSSTFIKTGGTIDGTNSAGVGRVVYGDHKRDTAAGPNVKLDSRVAGSAGGWE
jgi:hypothetical protein